MCIRDRLWFAGFGAAAWLIFWGIHHNSRQIEIDFLSFSAFSTGTFIFVFSLWKGFTSH